MVLLSRVAADARSEAGEHARRFQGALDEVAVQAPVLDGKAEEEILRDMACQGEEGVCRGPTDECRNEAHDAGARDVIGARVVRHVRAAQEVALPAHEVGRNAAEGRDKAMADELHEPGSAVVLEEDDHLRLQGGDSEEGRLHKTAPVEGDVHERVRGHVLQEVHVGVRQARAALLEAAGQDVRFVIPDVVETAKDHARDAEDDVAEGAVDDRCHVVAECNRVALASAEGGRLLRVRGGVEGREEPLLSGEGGGKVREAVVDLQDPRAHEEVEEHAQPVPEVVVELDPNRDLVDVGGHILVHPRKQAEEPHGRED
mmetsp:Transcript_10264/g.27855  ORF Transcript_10264/g.27855 Transcript_10264/m.27855 type:complete len:315 (-) Transcript_10264:94-1038(-)